MAKRGRPRKTAAELRLTGTHRPSRHGDGAATASVLPFRSPDAEREAELIQQHREQVHGDGGRKFYDDVTDAWAGWDPVRLSLLVSAALCVERMDEAQRLIDRDGLIVTGPRGGISRNPGIVIWQRACAEFRQLLRQLGLPSVES